MENIICLPRYGSTSWGCSWYRSSRSFRRYVRASSSWGCVTSSGMSLMRTVMNSSFSKRRSAKETCVSSTVSSWWLISFDWLTACGSPGESQSAVVSLSIPWWLRQNARGYQIIVILFEGSMESKKVRNIFEMIIEIKKKLQEYTILRAPM